MQSGHIEIQIKEKRSVNGGPCRNGWLIKSLYRLSEEKLIWWVGAGLSCFLKEFSKNFSCFMRSISQPTPGFL